jgi:hypothetical protein
MKRTSRTVSLLVALTSVLTLAACGGDESSADGVASVDDVASASTAEATPDGSTGAAVPEDEAVLAWAQCLRDNGIDVQDPTVDANGDIQFTPPADGAAFDPNSEEFQLAQAECSGLLGDTPFGGGANRDGLQDAFIVFTQCLRDEGLDVGDVDFSQRQTGAGGAGGRPANGAAGALDLEFLAGLIPGLDPELPATATAVDACADTLTEAFNDLNAGG